MGIMYGQKISENDLWTYMLWSLSYGPYHMIHITWGIQYGPYHMELCFETMSFWISLCLYYKNSNSDFYKFLWFFWFVMFSTIQWWGMKKCLVPCPWNFPLVQIDGPGFFIYIQFVKSEESLQVFDWFDYLLEDSIFFVWHCLPVCWSVGCAVRYIGVRRVYWSWFLNIHEHNAPYL